MNTTAIAQHLNVAESAIIEVQEWARVLWVRVRGLGARFVSKKVTTMRQLSRSEAAKYIKEEIDSNSDLDDFLVKVWEKGGRCRIYVQDYSGEKPEDIGFFHIADGEISFKNLKGGWELKKFVESLSIKVADDTEGREAMASSSGDRYLSGNAAWNAYHADHPAGYNRSTGEWDSPLDRDDHEG